MLHNKLKFEVLVKVSEVLVKVSEVLVKVSEVLEVKKTSISYILLV